MTDTFAAFGNLTIDDIVFADGSTSWGVPGGNAMYAGLGMAVWGERASVVAPVGPDYPMHSLGDRLDLSRCPPIPSSMRDWGLYEEDGTRHFVFRSSVRNWMDFSPRPQDAAAGRQSAAHLAPLPWDLQVALVQALREGGAVFISIDLDDRDLASVAPDQVGRLAASVDLFLPSRQDALAIFPDAEPVEAMRRLRDMAPDTPLIAVKCGAAGCVGHASGSREWIRVPAAPVEAVDATGAGDAFCGGALVGFAREADPLDALLFGAVSASFCVEALGFSRLIDADGAAARDRLEALRERVTFHPM
jgi:sugar/nucleoside kinase (ribokinase family)